MKVSALSFQKEPISHTLCFEGMRAELLEKHYVNIPFPLDQQAIKAAVQSFFRFLDEPDLIKSHIDFNITTNHRRGDVGFKHRDAGDDIYNDSKEFFHFHPAIFNKYPDFLRQNPAVDDFMTKAKPLWDATYTVVYDILKTFEPSFPGICQKIFDTEDVHILLRFLKYDWQSSGKYLAKPHFDAGAFTLAISESCSGLRIGSHPDNLKPVLHKENNAIFMISSNYKKVMDSADFSPGWHDVIQEDETFIGKPFARWAVVAFIEAIGVTALPRSETHKYYTS